MQSRTCNPDPETHLTRIRQAVEPRIANIGFLTCDLGVFAPWCEIVNFFTAPDAHTRKSSRLGKILGKGRIRVKNCAILTLDPLFSITSQEVPSFFVFSSRIASIRPTSIGFLRFEGARAERLLWAGEAVVALAARGAVKRWGIRGRADAAESAPGRAAFAIHRKTAPPAQCKFAHPDTSPTRDTGNSGSISVEIDQFVVNYLIYDNLSVIPQRPCRARKPSYCGISRTSG